MVDIKSTDTQKSEAQDRVALVTGGSRGIGRSIAERLAQDGYTVVINASKPEALEVAAAEMAATGARVFPYAADLSNRDAVKGMFDKVNSKFGRLDTLVNNAAISIRVDGRPPTLSGTPLDHWDKMLAVNLTGAFVASQAAVSLMQQNGWGRLIFIGSVGTRMFTGNSGLPYITAKAGLLGLARLLAAQLGPDGITVNTVAPGRIRTEMASTYANAEDLEAAYVRRTPVGRVGLPGDVAAAVSYLASEEAGFVNGAILDVNGGMFLP